VCVRNGMRDAEWSAFSGHSRLAATTFESESEQHTPRHCGQHLESRLGLCWNALRKVVDTVADGVRRGVTTRSSPELKRHSNLLPRLRSGLPSERVLYFGAEVWAAGCAGRPWIRCDFVSELESVSGSAAASEFCNSVGIATGEEVPSVLEPGWKRCSELHSSCAVSRWRSGLQGLPSVRQSASIDAR